MSRRQALLVLFVVVMVTCLGLIFGAGKSPEPARLGIVFTGKEPDPVYYGKEFRDRAAGISLTNAGSSALLISQVRVEVLSNGVWRPVFERLPGAPPVDARASSTDRGPRCLEAGREQKFLVPWPVRGTWRACFRYGRELGGPRLLVVKLLETWRSRSLPAWSAERRIFDKEQEFVSEGISQ